MSKGLALLAALLFTLSLSGCATQDRVDLPQLDDLRLKLMDSCNGKISAVDIYHFSTAPFLTIDVYSRELRDEEAFSLVRTVRETVMEEDFQRDYYDLMYSEDGWERVVSGQYYPDDIKVFIAADGGVYEFWTQLFSDGTPATGGKGVEYDGYATWRGSFEPFERGEEKRYFSHEDICE